MDTMTIDEQLAALDDVKVVAVTLYGETRSEPIDGQIAVANVIRNRMGERWKTYRDVCLAKLQFSCWFPEGGKANHKRVLALVERLAKGEAVDEHPYKQCAYIAYGIVHGWIKDDPTNGSRHYHTVNLTPRPKWAQSKVPVAQKGHHVFYNDVK
jgi:N-acetylmuramoyl-L-alanine amidase